MEISLNKQVVGFAPLRSARVAFSFEGIELQSEKLLSTSDLYETLREIVLKIR